MREEGNENLISMEMRIEFESKYMINAAKSSGVPDGNRKNFFCLLSIVSLVLYNSCSG